MEGNQFRPFCSERCKMIDLENWLSGRYRIATPASDGSEKENDAARDASEENFE